jgi:hypothetical protein
MKITINESQYYNLLENLSNTIDDEFIEEILRDENLIPTYSYEGSRSTFDGSTSYLIHIWFPDKKNAGNTVESTFSFTLRNGRLDLEYNFPKISDVVNFRYIPDDVFLDYFIRKSKKYLIKLSERFNGLHKIPLNK